MARGSDKREFERATGEVVEDERRPSLGERIAQWVPVYIAVMVTVLGIIVAFVVIDQAEQGNNLAEQSRDAAYGNRVASHEACVRSNAQRVAQVDAYLDVAEGNRRRAAAWALLFDDPVLPPTIVRFAHVQQRANLKEARAQIKNARQLAASQAEVATSPQSPSLIDRAVVDCDAVYPVPSDPDDPLPKPTKPAPF